MVKTYPYSLKEWGNILISSKEIQSEISFSQTLDFSHFPNNSNQKLFSLSCCASLLAEVSYDKAKWNERRETSAGFRRVVWWSRRPNFWSKLTGFQNRFRLMCNVCALLDCTLTIIESTVGYGFHEIREFRNFSLWSQTLFSGLCRTWQKRHWLLRKRERLRDRKLVGSRQRCLSSSFILPRRERLLLAGNSLLLFEIKRSNARCPIKIPTLGIYITVKLPRVARPRDPNPPPRAWHS